MRDTADHLRSVVETVTPRLRALSRSDVTRNPYPPRWSKIQVLGHLIDSACNNQMKFVLAMERPHTKVVGYAQNRWVDAQRYQDADWAHLVELWRLSNLHLAHVIENAPAEALAHTLTITGAQGDAGPFTLAFVMADYVEHMKHHLLQILPDAPLTHTFKNEYGA
ncbi:MAG TPA: DinB family protein [Phycisphaerales bacterium]|nr:DinB family protein [Phycisphaerales bacterium]